jgi:ribose-phosphate pyrophosphokinase
MKSIVVGQSGLPLASALAQRLGCDLISVGFSQFSDTECYLKYHPSISLEQTTVFVVFQFSRGTMVGDCMDSCLSAGSLNDQLVGLVSLLDLLAQQKAAAVHLILPYMVYSRQELSFDGRYLGAAYMLGRCLKSVGVRSIFACDLHEPTLINNFPVSSHHIPMTDLWASVARSSIVGQPGSARWCVFSPDEGGKNRAAALAQALGVSFGFVRKKRIGIDQAQARELVGEVQGMHVLVVDDIVDTARTAKSACELLKNEGALDVVYCNTHALFNEESCQRLLHVGCSQYFVTDTVVNGNVEHKDRLTVVSATDFIVERVLSLMQ